MEEQGVHLDELRTTAAELAQDGKTPLYFAQSQTLLGIISVSDVAKPTSSQAIAEMKQLGLEVVMLTGDNQRTARCHRPSAGSVPGHCAGIASG